MKKVIIALSLLLASCNSEAPPPKIEAIKLSIKSIPFADGAKCNTKPSIDLLKINNIYKYNLLEEQTINQKITREIKLNSIHGNEVRFTEYYVSQSMPPMLGNIGHQKFGFLPTKSGNRSLVYENIDAVFPTLEVSKPVDIPIKEMIDQGGSRSGLAKLTLTGCGILTETLGEFEDEPVHIYRLELPYTENPANQDFDAATEFEFIVSDRLNWPVVIRSPGSDLILTSFEPAGA